MNLKGKGKVGVTAKASIDMKKQIDEKIGIKGSYHFVCKDKDGNVKWTEDVDNIVVNVGLDDILDKYLDGSSYTAAFFMGLKDTGTPVAADTMALHASWGTITPYSNATDPALVWDAVSGQSIDNSGSPCVFNINATDDVYGAFLKTDNTKGGTAGTLLSVVDFSSARSVESGDTLNVTATFTMASA